MKCQINTHELRLIINPMNHNEIFLVRCCYKEYEKIKTFTYDEILNDNDLINTLKNAAKIMPLNHDYGVYDYCNSTEKICDWTQDDITTINVSTSHACNLRCIMCNYDKKIPDNDKDIYFAILNKIKNNKLGCISLTFEGEPFFYKTETMEYIRNLTTNDCLWLFIISNLTMLTEKDIMDLYAIQNEKNITIKFQASIDGITEETYKFIRNNNKFNQVINNAVLLNKLNMLSDINFVAMPENLHELSLLPEFWAEKGITNLNVLLYQGEEAKVNFVRNSKEWNEYKQIEKR